jgi:hypothetical protein
VSKLLKKGTGGGGGQRKTRWLFTRAISCHAGLFLLVANGEYLSVWRNPTRMRRAVRVRAAQGFRRRPVPLSPEGHEVNL